MMSNEEVVAFILMKKSKGVASSEIVKDIVEHAINELGSEDNVSVCLVDLIWDREYDTLQQYSPPPIPANPPVMRSRSRTRDRRVTKLYNQQKLTGIGLRNSASLSASEKQHVLNELDSFDGQGDVVQHINELIRRSSASARKQSNSNRKAAPNQQAKLDESDTHGWSVHKDSKGREFYYNAATKVSSWEKPEILKWAKAVTAEGKVYYYHTFTMETRWKLPNEDF